MSAGTWGGRAIDPRVREAALDAARRHNIQLGGWLGEALQTSLRDEFGHQDHETHDDGRGANRRVAEAIERLAQRIETAERRASLAVEGLDRTVVGLASRVEDTEMGAREEALRLFALVGELKTAQEILIERLARTDGPERADQIRTAVERIDQELTRLAARVEADMERIAARLDANESANAAERIDDVERRVQAFEMSREQAQDALNDVELSLRAAIEDADSRLSGRIADAHAATYGRIDELAGDLARVDEARRDGADAVERSIGDLDQRISERLADLRASVERAADQATAAERAAEDVARAFAETVSSLGARIEAVQASSDASIERVAGEMRAALDARTDALAGALDALKASFDGVVENLRTDEIEAGLAAANRRISASEVLQDQTIEAVSVEIKRLSEAFDRRMRALEDANQKLDLPKLIEKVQASSEHKLAGVDARALEAAAALSARLDALGADLAAARTDVSRHVAAAAAELDLKLQARLDGAFDEIDQRLARVAAPEAAGAEPAPPNAPRPAPSADARVDTPEPAPAPRPFVVPKVQGMFVTASQLTPRPLAQKPAAAPSPTPVATAAAANPARVEPPAAETATASRAETTTDADRWDTLLGDDFPIDIDPAEPLGAAPLLDDLAEDSAAAARAFDRFRRDAEADAELDIVAVDERPATAPQPPATPLGAGIDDDGWSLPEPSEAAAPREPFGAPKAPPAPADPEAPRADHARVLESDPDLDLDILEAEPPPLPTRKNDYISEARRAAMQAAMPAKPKKSLARSPRVLIAGAIGVAAAAGGATLMLRGGEPAHETAAPAPAPTHTAAPVAAAPGSIAEAAAKLAQTPAPQSVPAAPTITLEAAAERGDSVAIYELARQKLASGASDEGFTLMRKAADKGLAAAQYRLAKLYERGEGVPADIASARQWTERAALGGNRAAMHDLGVYYARGEGIPLNEAQAYRWFRQAADLGMTNSQYNLGVLYQTGRGVAADPEEALFWFSVAAASEDSDAAARSASLASRLAPETVSQIDARAAAFRPKPMNPRANGDFGPQPWAAPSAETNTAPRG